ncbi:hypothetical protein [Streptococcus sp. X13SY08]|nr:hypothetical protein [Streptococcus sp. X13SY08]
MHPVTPKAQLPATGDNHSILIWNNWERLGKDLPHFPLCIVDVQGGG